MINRQSFKVLLILLLTASGLKAWGEEQTGSLVLIVNPDSGVTEIDREAAVNIFMGRYNELPSGVSAIPVDYVPAKEDFYQQLVNKRLSEINGYWARLVFSGRASPPLQLRGAEEVLEFVASNRGAIGYVRRDSVDDRVRALTALR